MGIYLYELAQATINGLRFNQGSSLQKVGGVAIEQSKNFYLQPGFIFVSQEPHYIHTVLGSCVSVCLWDSLNMFGGMNHYIYANCDTDDPNGRYGEVSLPHLLKLMQDMGSKKTNLRAHLVGGARNAQLSSLVGDENVILAEKWLKKNRIPIIVKDVGGTHGRKIVFHNQSGEVYVYRVEQVRRSDWYR
jgi:chemotaxis protein CheD